MKEIRVHLFRYLPLVEILWSEDIRDNIQFLADKTEFNDKLKQLLTFQNKDKNRELGFFMHHYGPLKWDINKDGMIYLRTIQHLISENQPFRPLVPFSTPTKKSKELGIVSNSVFNVGRSVSIYPQLVCEIRRSFSIKIDETEKIDYIIREFKRHFFKNERKETDVIFKSIFTKKPRISIRMSDVYVLIESTVDTFKKTNYLNDLSEARRLSRLWIKKVEQNNWLLVYGNPKPHPKQRLRTLKVFQIYNLLFILRNRIQHLIRNRIDEDLDSVQKIIFFEFILTTLNLNYYSATDSPTYFFPKSYLRVLFNEICFVIGQKDAFNELLKNLQSIFYSWDDFTQSILLKENNIPLNMFKQKLSFIKKDHQKLVLTAKEKLMLEFFIELYKNEDIDYNWKKATYISYKNYLKYNKIKGYSLNQIRNKIIPWQENKSSGEKFTVRELRETKPKVLYRLEKLELIIAEKQEKTRTKYTYCLNIIHPYVKELLRK